MNNKSGSRQSISLLRGPPGTIIPNSRIIGSFFTSYHPYIIVSWRVVYHKVWAMTQRAVVMISKVPFLQALPVEDVKAFQLADFLGAVHLFQANSTGNSVSTDAIL